MSVVESQYMIKTEAKPAPPLGVVGALVAGFETVNARLDLILLPLALDLFLWLGPHVSVQPLADRLIGIMRVPPGTDAATRRNFEVLRDALADALADYGAHFNLFSILSTAPLGLPSLLAGRAPVEAPGLDLAIWPVESVLLYVLLFGVFVLAGLFLGALYFGSIAQQVRSARLNVRQLLGQVWGDWARLTALAVIILIVLLVPGIPLLIMSGVLTSFSPLVGGLVWLVGVTVLLWLLFYAGFALHGIILQRRGLFGALWDSARLVQVNLPHTAGLYVVIVLLNMGLGLVWNLPADGSWFLLLGLGGHALVSTALVAATFVFYQDRYRRWTEMREARQARAQAGQGSVNRKA